MASSHGAPPVFNNKVVAWIDHRLPIFSYMEKEYRTFPTPRNFNYFWNFGAIATVMLVLMIATGVVLATNYTPHTTMAFDSVERIIRDVPSGWVITNLHVHGSNNRLGIYPKGPQDTVSFHPYYTMKDGFGLTIFLIVYAGFVFFAPVSLGDPANFIPANPLVMPEHIVPEWYFLPFYAI